MHFDQQMLTQIREKAQTLERARIQLDTAQKQCAEWETIERLQRQFDAAQEAMVQVGVQASHSLPPSLLREVKEEG